MNRRLRFARSVFGLVAVWAVTVSVVVAFTFSESNLVSGRPPWEEELLAIVADPDAARLVMIFVRFLGTLLGVVGVSIALLVFGPLRRDEPWAKPVVIVLSLGLLIPQLLFNISLGNPAFVIAVLCILLVLVLISATLLIVGRAEASSGTES